MNASAKPVLLVAYINSQLPELLRVSRWLQQSTEFQPILLYHEEFEFLQPQFIAQAHGDQIEFIRADGTAIQPVVSDGTPTPKMTPGRWLAYLGQRRTGLSWPGRLANWGYGRYKLATMTKRLRQQRDRAANLLQQRQIRLLVLTEENVSYHTAVYTQPATQSDIPVVITPYTIANATEAAEHAYDNPARHVRGPWARRLARRYPQWVYHYRGQDLLPLPGGEIQALERLGLASPHPWTLNDGQSTLAVESPVMMAYHQENGIEPKRLVLTGSLSDDALHTTKLNAATDRQKLYHQFHLDNRPFVLCGMPPPWFPRPAGDFSNYRELVTAWMKTLTDQDEFHVIVNLHPRIRRAEIADIITSTGAIIVDQDLTTLLPLAELYVASISATIRWAIACGVPVVNYDVYKYGFHDYDAVPGVVTMDRYETFVRAYHRFVTDQAYRAVLTADQRQVMTDWGCLDGKSGQRLLTLFERLTASSATR